MSICLEEILEDGFDVEELLEGIRDRNRLMIIRYNIAKDKEIGETIKCACCGKDVVKKTKAQAFCNKTKKGSSCKDIFHNSVNENRWRRTIPGVY